MPHCCRVFLAVIVATPLQKITEWLKSWTMDHGPSSVKRKRVAEDFSAFGTQDGEV